MKKKNCVIEDLSNNTEYAKAEAIKEFAERLKERAWHGIWEVTNHVDVDDIDNLVKEMVGAESG